MTLWSGRFDTAPDPAAFDFAGLEALRGTGIADAPAAPAIEPWDED